MVGILPVTIRAWERRYGWPRPERGSQGYRLYSETDVRVLRWLKSQLQAGMSIRQAANLLNQHFAAGMDPTALTPGTSSIPVNLEHYRRQIQDQLLHFDQSGALVTLRQAYALYPLDNIMEELLQPVLVQIGDGWAAGEVSIPGEHFASQFVKTHLMSQLNAQPAAWLPGVIAAGCLPGEEHDLGLLMLVVMLRSRGRDVRYFGPNLDLERLPATLGAIQPRLILLSATLPAAAANLEHIAPILNRFSKPRPTIVVGGQAFSGKPKDEAAFIEGKKGEPLPVIRLMGSLTTIAESVNRLMRS
jgi:DNA-binding transcriptional MerR regulator